MRGQLKKESEALYFGSLYDLLLFEPEKFADTYYTLDDSDIVADIGGKYPRSTKRYKEWKAEAAQATENANKILAPMEDVKKAKEMIQRLKDCGLYDKRFAGGKYQVEFNVDLDGVPLKGSWIVFRTTVSSTQSLLARSASSGMTSIALAMTSKPTSTPKCLVSRTSTGSCRKRLTPFILQT